MSIGKLKQVKASFNWDAPILILRISVAVDHTEHGIHGRARAYFQALAVEQMTNKNG